MMRKICLYPWLGWMNRQTTFVSVLCCWNFTAFRNGSKYFFFSWYESNRILLGRNLNNRFHLRGHARIPLCLMKYITLKTMKIKSSTSPVDRENNSQNLMRLEFSWFKLSELRTLLRCFSMMIYHLTYIYTTNAILTGLHSIMRYTNCIWNKLVRKIDTTEGAEWEPNAQIEIIYWIKELSFSLC